MIDALIIAADVKNLTELNLLISQTRDIPKVAGYKVGFSLALKYGLPKVVQFIRNLTEEYPTRIIYDHQKAGNDIPDMGEPFAALMSESDIDDVILFPFAGRETTRAWIQACQTHQLNVLFGCIMTHAGFFTSQGGIIDSRNILNTLDIAIDRGVTHFVFPGVFHKEETRDVTQEALTRLKDSVEALDIYTPGIGAQGGSIEGFLEVAQLGPADFYIPIVGRAIYGAKDIRAATLAIIGK
jgi:orotidine-5'-phosphate decarboxylase